jgi:ATP-dependent DNA ligase
MPDVRELFASGKVRFQAGYDKMVAGAMNYFYAHQSEGMKFIVGPQPYSVRRRFRDNLWGDTIGSGEIETYKRDVAKNYFDNIIAIGGEGIVMKSPDNIWTPTRNKDVLKWKPHTDTEAVVTGYTEGKGKYEGMVGALICRGADDSTIPGVVFEASGMTDAERVNGVIPIGAVVTVRYRELSDKGVPKEPRYMRVREA